jgi:hypothetical protein
MVFKPGQSGNPAGRHSARQDFVTRAKYLSENYDVEKIREVMTDKKKHAKLSAFDAIVLARLYEAIEVGGKDSAMMLLDRLIGKPKQEVKVDSNVNVNVQLQSAVGDVKRLSTETLKSISAMLEENVINGEYQVIQDSE